MQTKQYYKTRSWENGSSPLITFVVPAYQTENYLPHTLKSFLKIDAVNAEIIIVHDGGKDGTLNIARSWQDQNDHLRIMIVDQQNAGLAAARHSGVECARGRYLAFCDSDDFVDLEAYAELARLADSHHCELAMCRAVAFDHMHGWFHDFYDAHTFDEIVGDQKFVVTSWAQEPKIFSLEPNANTRIIKRDFFLKNGLQFTVGKQYEDIAPHTKALCLAKHVGFLNRTGFYYRVGRPGAITKEGGMRRFDVLHGVEAAVASALVTGLPDAAKAALLSMLLRMVFWCGQLVPKQNALEFAREARTILLPLLSDESISVGLKGYFRTQRDALLALALRDGEVDILSKRLRHERWAASWRTARFILRNMREIKIGLKHFKN